jgi:hypothetical protein
MGEEKAACNFSVIAALDEKVTNVYDLTRLVAKEYFIKKCGCHLQHIC